MYKSVSTHSKSSPVHVEGKRSKQRQRRYSVEVESGCCAIFDFDFDYDDDEEDDDEAYDDAMGYEYDDYYDYYDDEDEQQLELEQQDDADCSMLGTQRAPKTRARMAAVKVKGQRQRQHHRRTNNNIRSVLINKRHNKYKITRPQTQLEVINESERSAGSGSDENDSLLVAYDSSSSLASV